MGVWCGGQRVDRGQVGEVAYARQGYGVVSHQPGLTVAREEA